SSSAYARRLVCATSSRQATRRGQARHTLERASTSARECEPAASLRTPPADFATGVSAVAGSWGHKLMDPSSRNRSAPRARVNTAFLRNYEAVRRDAQHARRYTDANS